MLSWNGGRRWSGKSELRSSLLKRLLKRRREGETRSCSYALRGSIYSLIDSLVESGLHHRNAAVRLKNGDGSRSWKGSGRKRKLSGSCSLTESGRWPSGGGSSSSPSTLLSPWKAVSLSASLLK